MNAAPFLPLWLASLAAAVAPIRNSRSGDALLTDEEPDKLGFQKLKDGTLLRALGLTNLQKKGGVTLGLK